MSNTELKAIETTIIIDGVSIFKNPEQFATCSLVHILDQDLDVDMTLTQKSSQWYVVDKDLNVVEGSFNKAFFKAYFYKKLTDVYHELNHTLKSFKALNQSGASEAGVWKEHHLKMFESKVSDPTEIQPMGAFFKSVQNLGVELSSFRSDLWMDTGVRYQWGYENMQADTLLLYLSDAINNFTGNIQNCLEDMEDAENAGICLVQIMRAAKELHRMFHAQDLFGGCLRKPVVQLEDAALSAPMVMPQFNPFISDTPVPMGGISAPQYVPQQGFVPVQPGQTPQQRVGELIDQLGQQSVSIPSRLEGLFPPELREAFAKGNVQLQSVEHHQPEQGVQNPTPAPKTPGLNY